MTSPRLGSYCYALLDTRKPGLYQYIIDGIEVSFDFEPFYIGKGRGERDVKHLYPCVYTKKQHPKNSKIAKIVSVGLKPMAVRFFSDLSDEVALSREIKAIAAIGRADTQNGPLANLSDGGEGATGNRWSDEARKRFSEQKRGIPLSESARASVAAAAAKRKGEKRPEVGIKISEALRGKPKSPDHAAKITERNKSRAGIKPTEETRAKMRAAYSKHVLSDEARDKGSLIDGALFRRIPALVLALQQRQDLLSCVNPRRN